MANPYVRPARFYVRVEGLPVVALGGANSWSMPLKRAGRLVEIQMRVDADETVLVAAPTATDKVLLMAASLRITLSSKVLLDGSLFEGSVPMNEPAAAGAVLTVESTTPAIVNDAHLTVVLVYAV